MEIYRDLSEFHQLKTGKTQTSVADELNTPVFEKARFDYDRQLHSSDLLNVITSKEDQSYSVSNMDTVHIDDMNNILSQEDGVASENKDLNLISLDKDAAKVLNYVVINSQGINSNQSNMHTLDNSEFEYIYHDSNKVTPMLKELVCEDEYLPTVNNYSDIFFNNTDDTCPENVDIDNASIDFTNDQYIIFDASPIASPEISKSSESSCHSSPSLNLQLDCSATKITESFNTPDVIDTIDAIQLEKGFNILNFITEDDSIKPEPIIPTEDVSLPSSVSDDFSTIPVTKRALKRKIKAEEDDDEDYKPPSSFMKQKKHCKQINSDYIENGIVTKPTRRGRPPKQVSAEVFKRVHDDEDEKYREMRDKNNEASRKSRLKRRMKEVAQEEEAQELEDRNVKLKAQVAELERTVNNFRTNLMQILLKK